MRDEMKKTMSLALALAFGLTWQIPSAGAMSPGATLGTLSQSDIVSIVQKQRRGKGKRQQMNLSQEHKQKIRETVPAEYHQYLPKSITGGTPAASGAAGAR
jgi:hypothetical protein